MSSCASTKGDRWDVTWWVERANARLVWRTPRAGVLTMAMCHGSSDAAQESARTRPDSVSSLR